MSSAERCEKAVAEGSFSRPSLLAPLEISRACNNRTASYAGQLTSLACTFCFPISDNVMFSREFSFCVFISYAYIYTCIGRHLKETSP